MPLQKSRRVISKRKKKQCPGQPQTVCITRFPRELNLQRQCSIRFARELSRPLAELTWGPVESFPSFQSTPALRHLCRRDNQLPPQEFDLCVCKYTLVTFNSVYSSCAHGASEFFCWVEMECGLCFGIVSQQRGTNEANRRGREKFQHFSILFAAGLSLRLRNARSCRDAFSL